MLRDPILGREGPVERVQRVARAGGARIFMPAALAVRGIAPICPSVGNGCLAIHRPSVRKEGINITINGNEVAVAAEVKQEKLVRNGDTMLCTERFYGTIKRAFSLGSEVDEASAQARYDNGVLELTLPKKTAAAAKRLAVH